MWRLKIKLSPKGQFLGTLAVKHDVSLMGYSSSYSKHKNCIYVTLLGLLFGEENNKKEFIRDLKSYPSFIKGEFNNDFAIVIIKEPIFSEPVYNPGIIRPSPAIINKKGYHVWDLASFDRKLLERVIAFCEKHLEAEILSFGQEKIDNISILKVLPELTKNQKKALEIAIVNGYYDYPKKVKLESLAKKMSISYSTYQAHLKKAEGKVVPTVLKEL